MERFTLHKDCGIHDHKKTVIYDLDTFIGVLNIIQEMNRLDYKNELLTQQLNYIQSSITEAINHQKTEIGQKALKQVIEDYNKYLLEENPE